MNVDELLPRQCGAARRGEPADFAGALSVAAKAWWHELRVEPRAGSMLLLMGVVLPGSALGLFGWALATAPTAMFTSVLAAAAVLAVASLGLMVVMPAVIAWWCTHPTERRGGYVLTDEAGTVRSALCVRQQGGQWAVGEHVAWPPRQGWGGQLRRELAAGISSVLDSHGIALSLRAINTRMAEVYTRDFNDELVQVGRPSPTGFVTMRRAPRPARRQPTLASAARAGST